MQQKTQSAHRSPYMFMAIAFVLVFDGMVYAQSGVSTSQPGAGSRRNFTLTGDLKVDDSQADASQKAAVYDVILYTRGSDVFSRQRVGNGNRYRFNNIFNGDYYLAVEFEGALGMLILAEWQQHDP